MTDPEQMQFGGGPVTLHAEEMKLDRFPVELIGNLTGPKPRPDFLSDIREKGMLQPITIRIDEYGQVGLIEGRRRLRAVLALRDEVPPSGVTPAAWRKRWSSIQVVRVDDPNGWAFDQIGVSLNEQRSDNVSYLLAVIERCEARGLDEKGIAKELNIRIQRVRRIKRLFGLHPDLRGAFDDDAITQSIAEECARLGMELQAELAELLRDKGELTRVMIREAKGEPAQEEMPLERGRFVWKNTVRDHLTQALRIADSYKDTPVVSKIKEAITALDGSELADRGQAAQDERVVAMEGRRRRAAASES